VVDVVLAPRPFPPRGGKVNEAMVKPALPEMKAASQDRRRAVSSTPQEGAAFLKSEYEKWKKVLTDGNIKEKLTYDPTHRSVDRAACSSRSPQPRPTAQSYPTKPIKLVLPYSPGAIDYGGPARWRIISAIPSVSRWWPRTARRGRHRGTDTVARSQADGYTLVIMDRRSSSIARYSRAFPTTCSKARHGRNGFLARGMRSCTGSTVRCRPTCLRAKQTIATVTSCLNRS